MADYFQTRPERLAAERRAAIRAERTAPPPRLNPPFPYVMIPLDARIFKARPVWAVTVEKAVDPGS
jgi:hypothetical protein